jgi:hypothetical protein
MESKLDLLQRVQKVEAPPFLYTRILQRIQYLQEAPAPVKWRFAFAAMAVVLLLLNMSVLVSSKPKAAQGTIEPVVNSMHLSTSNELYHE